MPHVNKKYAMDRQATQGMVMKLLAERDQVFALLCRLSRLRPFEREKLGATLVTKFCQLLTDYIAAAHFGLYERLESQTERRRPVLEVAASVYPGIAATTELALEFSERYCGAGSKDADSDLKLDLARLGEVLARRIEMEDRLIASLVAPAAAPRG